MAKRTGRLKKEAPEDLTKLIAAFKFLEPAASLEGPANQTHCNIRNNTVVIFNGLTAFGIVLPVAIPACNPHLLMLISALEKCKEMPAITLEVDPGYLRIKAGRFTAYVPCLPDDLFAPIVPASPVAALTDTFKASLAIVGAVADEHATRQVAATVFVRNGSAVATDGRVIFEHWHGNNVPNMSLPKIATVTLCKIVKPLTSFGITWNEDQTKVNSITFWFDDNSWFRTQLYVEPWPPLDKPLEAPANLWPIPVGLWQALESISDFTDEYDRVFLKLKTVSTHETPDLGAVYEIEGNLPDETIILNHELTLMFAPHAKQVDWNATDDMVKFQGDNFRGCLMKIKMDNADKP